MNGDKTKRIRDTLASLEKKRKRIQKIEKLVNRKIDRKFHLDLNELTPSEIDFEMGRRAASLRENADPRVYLNKIPGRNKMVKILMIFPFFLRLIFVKPVSIVRDFMFFNNALLVRMRNADERLSRMENRLNTALDASTADDGESG